MTLWDFALAAWERTGVSRACLDLQDQHGQSISLLIWGAWAVDQGRQLDDTTITAAIDLTRTWESGFLGPIRSARRRLARPLPGLAGPQREDLLRKLRSFELDGERTLAAALEAVTPPASPAPQVLASTLISVAERWNGAVPEPALRALARRLG